MENITHLINSQNRGVPRNWQNLEIVIDWLNKKESGTVNVSDLAFVQEAQKYIEEHIQQGLSSGVGIFEGIPYDIVLGNILNPVWKFEGYLDLTDDLTQIGGEEIICSLKKRKGEDWINDVADGFSMAYLYDKGVIRNSDFVKVPYVINFIPDGLQLILLSMSLYMMTKELIENIEKLSEAIAELTDASTPVVSYGLGANSGGPVLVVSNGWDLGNFILVSLKVLARIAYTIAIVIAIKNLIEQIFEQLLPKKRYHLGMTFRKMAERSCEYLGLTFQSSITELDWVHIPRKDRKGGESGEYGFPASDEPIYTFGDLIRTLKEMFNADYRIKNGVFYLERRDFFATASSFQLPDYFTNQQRKLNQFKYNTNEMVSNYSIVWAYDIQDQNTLEDQTGRIFQAITTPVIKTNEDLINIKGLTKIDIPFSLGKCKTSLTAVEKLAKVLGQFVDNLTGIFGGGTNFASQIENRNGSLLLSSHFLTYGKVVVMSGGKLVSNQRQVLSAKLLFDKFHYINSFAEVNGMHNQYIRYFDFVVPMSLEQFNQLLENNIGTTTDGLQFYVETCSYNQYKRTARLDVRINKKYTNNLKIEYVSR